MTFLATLYTQTQLITKQKINFKGINLKDKTRKRKQVNFFMNENRM